MKVVDFVKYKKKIQGKTLDYKVETFEDFEGILSSGLIFIQNFSKEDLFAQHSAMQYWAKQLYGWLSMNKGFITFVEPHEHKRHWVYSDKEETLRLVAEYLERATMNVNHRMTVEDLEIYLGDRKLMRNVHGRWL